MANKTELVCAKQFSAQSKDYAVGDVIPKKEYMEWPDESLPNRLAHGFVKYENVEVAAKSPAEPVAAPNTP